MGRIVRLYLPDRKKAVFFCRTESENPQKPNRDVGRKIKKSKKVKIFSQTKNTEFSRGWESFARGG